nr:MAG TPA: hypothetical protein [Crassvirales sp.]
MDDIFYPQHITPMYNLGRQLMNNSSHLSLNTSH